ncbi:hypothetical protein P4114_15100 [Pseudomonas aeruginosa]|nr:hypothetical protein [Pseudomonas aeruginosa]
MPRRPGPTASTPSHPALLRLIAQTCGRSARHGRWVGVCGALASDPLATPVLVGLGVEELSVGPNLVGEIKTGCASSTPLNTAPPPRPRRYVDLGSPRCATPASSWSLA